MKHTIAILALLLSACGGGSVAPCASDVVRVTIVRGVTFPAGATTEYDGCDVTITVDFHNNGPYGLPQIVAHELGHAALGPNHSDDPGCLMYGGAIDIMLTEPCPDEALRMAAWGDKHTLEIVGCSPDLAAATVEAINLWNTPGAFRSFNGSQGE